MFSVRSVHIALLLWGGIFCICISLFMLGNRELRSGKRRWILYIEMVAAILLVSDAMAFLFRGRAGMVAFIMVRIGNFLVFFLSDVLVLLYHTEVVSWLYEPQGEKRISLPDLILLPKRNGRAAAQGNVQGSQFFAVPEEERTEQRYPFQIYLISWVSIAGGLLVILSQFTDIYYYFDQDNFYHRNTWHPISLLVGLFGMMADLYLIYKHRHRLKKNVRTALASFAVFPIVGTAGLLFYYGISLANIGIAISVVYMFFVLIHEQDRELAEAKTQVMLSQIKPHFLFNTITAIQDMCVTDPQEASDTLRDFADYLRGNMDALTQNTCISFSRELQHTRKYLSIEQKRFGDRVRVDYDIEEEGFFLPSLTLQPLVENAVRHGITQREEGGTIHIRTFHEPEAYVVRVEDDGPGLRWSGADARKDKSHIGLANVRERLREMAKGTLSVTSIPEKGTICEIRIPDEAHRRRRGKQ